MFWFKKKERLPPISHEHDHQKRERLFFHDMINLTHGLILFLNQRQSSHKTISALEIQGLEREVRTLQSLIKDHFQYKHKNLSLGDDWVPFKIAEIAVKSLIQTYLPEESVKTFVHRDFLDDESSVVYFPVFYRIMNNLIKNMAEAHAHEAHISFNYTNEGLIIHTRNPRGPRGDSNKVTDGFSQLGIESVRHLALECGGTFDFEISNNHWINRVLLPRWVKEPKKAA